MLEGGSGYGRVCSLTLNSSFPSVLLCFFELAQSRPEGLQFLFWLDMATVTKLLRKVDAAALAHRGEKGSHWEVAESEMGTTVPS